MNRSFSVEISQNFYGEKFGQGNISVFPDSNPVDISKLDPYKCQLIPLKFLNVQVICRSHIWNLSLGKMICSQDLLHLKRTPCSVHLSNIFEILKKYLHICFEYR